jgi:ribosomal protein L1
VISDSFEDVLEIDLRVEAVELGRAKQRVDGCGALPSGVRSDEEIVLATDGNDAQGAFGGVVVDLQLSVVDITR